MNERYYQFIIWRALMSASSSFPWRSERERGGHDLAFYDDKTDALVAVAEMKNYFSNEGTKEIPGIKTGVDLKLGILKIPGVMLILTVRAKGNDEPLEFLSQQLGIEQSAFKTSAFDIDPFPGETKPAEFMVIGFLAGSKSLSTVA